MKFKKYIATSAVAFASMALSANIAYAACATDSLPSSTAKPGGFPERALTMVVPYGPAGGSGHSRDSCHASQSNVEPPLDSLAGGS